MVADWVAECTRLRWEHSRVLEMGGDVKSWGCVDGEGRCLWACGWDVYVLGDLQGLGRVGAWRASWVRGGANQMAGCTLLILYLGSWNGFRKVKITEVARLALLLKSGEQQCAFTSRPLDTTSLSFKQSKY